MKNGVGSGSIIERCGPEDPDQHKNVTDLQHTLPETYLLVGSDTSADSGEEDGGGANLDNVVYVMDARKRRVRQYVCQFCSNFTTRTR